MITSRAASRFRISTNLTRRCLSSSTLRQGGRTAPYRRIQKITNHDRTGPSEPVLLFPCSQTPLLDILNRRPFSTTTQRSAISFRDLKSDGKSKEAAPKEQPKQEQKTDPAEEAYQQATRENLDKARAEREKQRARAEEESSRKEETEEETGEGDRNKKEEKKKETPPPPPPHGNKSPWQVFTETLKTEFKASKEWNESTKQLASSANQFTENESVKRARAAYSAASGAATSGTASVLKNTGRAVGQTAARTWDSSVVKGVRAGANAAGRGIDKATQPIRETSAFKSVKNVVDDGSSSRYGGWVEKEERRKRREQREIEEAAASGRPGRRNEKIEEDPEFVAPIYVSTNSH